MKKERIIWLLQIISLIIVTITFALSVESFIETRVIGKSKHECWYTFISVMIFIGIVYFLFQKFIWKKCVSYAQKEFFNWINLK